MPSSSTSLTSTTHTTPPNVIHGYTELHDGLTENFDSDAGIWEMTRVFQGAWDKRHDFVKEFMPYIDTSGGMLIPKMGSIYPDYPLARAYKAGVEPQGKSSLNPVTYQIEYEKAKVTIGYKTSPGSDLNLPTPNPNNPDQFTFVTEEGHPEIEVLKIPPRARKHIIPSNVPIVKEAVDDPYDIYLPHIHYTFTQHFVPQPNWAAIDDAMGKLNSVTFRTISGHTAVPRTLMYYGPTFSKKYTINEITAWEMQHDFLYKKIKGGWEQKFDKKVGNFVEVFLKVWDATLTDYTDVRPYDTYDHNKIFAPTLTSSGP